MNKNAIKNFAVRARRKLIEDITQKVYELGITENDIKEIETFEGGFRVNGVVNGKTYKKYETKQREKLIKKINISGYEYVVEEVAYTWFNRFIALRFMEINEYLPTGVRMLSSKEEGKTEPDIIKEALNVELDVDKDLVYKLIDSNDIEDLYKYLLVKQCNELGKIMPMVFEKISDYTELLLPDKLLDEGSVIRDLINSINEEDFTEQIEIIGWLYQYYNQEKRDYIFDSNMSDRRKILKSEIPAATQIFTPKWIVDFIVQNSLGRYWQEKKRDEDLINKWNYYLENEDLVNVCNTKESNVSFDPKNIKVFDPSMGSGHILVVCFDILFDIYLKSGYNERDIPKLILENNLYGLEIDDRAAQLAYFSLYMKARSKSSRIFRSALSINICSIKESNNISKECMEYFIGENSKIRESLNYLINIYMDAKIYGSIIEIDKSQVDFKLLNERINEIKDEEIDNIFQYSYRDDALTKIGDLINQAKIMAQKYNITITNPPYMGNRRMEESLKDYINKKYSDVKTDLFSVFIKKCILYTSNDGFIGIVAPYVLWFINSFERLRTYVLENTTITSVVQLEYNAFEGATIPVGTFVLRNRKLGIKGEYIKLSDFKGIKEQPVKVLEAIEKQNVSYRYSTNQENYMNIPENIFAYWISDNMINNFKGSISIDSISDFTGSQNITADNNKYLRLLWEVDKEKILNRDWVFYSKGGDFRKHYGNLEYVVDWTLDARRFYKENKTSNLLDEKYWYKEGISYNGISTRGTGFRYLPVGCVFDKGGPAISNVDSIYYILALLNSKITSEYLSLLNPTINIQVKDIKNIPIIIDQTYYSIVEKIEKNNVDICKMDWDSLETSWDFQYHPLLNYSKIRNNKELNSLETALDKMTVFMNEQYKKLKYNEEEINKMFIEIYNLQEELNPEVEDKDIIINKADRERDIKSFISYAVGCMFGRYSLDEDGLIYAGGEFNSNRYSKYNPISDNVLVIVDDEYFEDDIVNRFIEFVKVTFGEKTIEENLDYIAETLGQKTGETSRQTIRRYFLKDFYDNHVKIYQKRPIYWQFDSGKQNGFKALIYMHRYDSSTVARVRIDYLHKLQKKYEAELKRLDTLLESDLSPRDAAAAKKKKDSISKQIQECLLYDQVIAHVANQKIEIDLDDGVAVNYEKFQNVEVPQGEGKKPLKANLLAKIQ